jgi:hypothetical protein
MSLEQLQRRIQSLDEKQFHSFVSKSGIIELDVSQQ